MTPSPLDALWLTSDPRGSLERTRFGKDRLPPKQDPVEVGVVLLDTFDGQVAAGGRLLVSGPVIPMRPETSAYRAATDIIHAHIAVALTNEAGTLADIDSEFLHDYRQQAAPKEDPRLLLDGAAIEDAAR